jgi:hydroxyethylthiazole kinase-like uncharacterized protein yjeF
MSLTRITRDFLRAHPLPQPDGGGDKQLRGRVLVVGGSRDVPGAALLAGLGALRAGAGVLQIATVRCAAMHLGLAMPEALVAGCDETAEGGIDPADAPRIRELAARANAVLVGPGMLDKEAIAALTTDLLAGLEAPAFVLDASAFTTLRDAGLARRVAVTPHAGEMAGYLGIAREEVEADPLAAAQRAARELGAVVAMKGAETIVTDGTDAFLATNGSLALATSGSGDTLAGLLAGLLARGADPLLATQWAVWLHAEAGARLAARHGTFGLLAREFPGEVPGLLREFAVG